MAVTTAASVSAFCQSMVPPCGYEGCSPFPNSIMPSYQSARSPPFYEATGKSLALSLINSKAGGCSTMRMLQLVGLEPTTKAGGRDRIDHPRGLHDDVANAAAGALVFAYQASGYSRQQRFRDNL